MSTTIKPTVGRVVLIFFAAGAMMPGFAAPTNPLTPVPGLIARVHSDTCINVAAFDVYGAGMPFSSVRLLQDGDERPTSGFWAEWMPYQVGQAKKAEDRKQDTKQLAAGDGDADARRVRCGILDLALRTPGLSGPRDVLAAARVYQAHIDGEATTLTPQQLAERPSLGAAFPGYSAMPPHQQRVVDEKCQLDARLAKLIPFFDTTIFAGLSEDEKSRLERQEEAMKAYSAILTERIAAFQITASTAV